MIYKETKELAGSIAGASDNTNFLHSLMLSQQASLGFAVLDLVVVVNLHLIAEYLCESLHIVGGPSLVDLSILAEVGLHQIKRRVDTHEGVGVGAESKLHSACDVALRAFEPLLDVAHHRLQVLSLM